MKDGYLTSQERKAVDLVISTIVGMKLADQVRVMASVALLRPEVVAHGPFQDWCRKPEVLELTKSGFVQELGLR